MATYLITGATGGIGTALAVLLQESGHDLILAGRSAERLAALESRLRSPGFGRTQSFSPATPPSSPGSLLRPLVLDLTQPRRMEAALVEMDLPEKLDGVIHNAGTIEHGRVADLTAEEWHEQLTVNLLAPAELTRILLPSLRAARGHVVFVNSGAGIRATPGNAAYAAGKFGLRALADALRAEEPEISVTSVFPGRTDTQMQHRLRAQEGGAYEADKYLSPETVARVIAQTLSMPRDAVVNEISVRPPGSPL